VTDLITSAVNPRFFLPPISAKNKQAWVNGWNNYGSVILFTLKENLSCRLSYWEIF